MSEERVDASFWKRPTPFPFPPSPCAHHIETSYVISHTCPMGPWMVSFSGGLGGFVVAGTARVKKSPLPPSGILAVVYSGILAVVSFVCLCSLVVRFGFLPVCSLAYVLDGVKKITPRT